MAAAASDLPTLTVPRAELDEGIWIVKLFVDSGLGKSNGEVRRLIRGGGCYLNDVRITDDKLNVGLDDLQDGQLMIRAGKKNRRRVVAE